jgi:hypothetical protein
MKQAGNRRPVSLFVVNYDFAAKSLVLAAASTR